MATLKLSSPMKKSKWERLVDFLSALIMALGTCFLLGLLSRVLWTALRDGWTFFGLWK